MTQVHIVLQHKGGVGKSVAASFIAQYLKELGSPFVAIDTDPNNPTLSGYKALKAQRLELLVNGAIAPRNFDSLIEQLLTEKETNFVIDNGSSNFFPFTDYMVKNNIPAMLTEEGKEVYIHTVVKGGQEIKTTLAGFNNLAEEMPEQAKIVVWLNEFVAAVKGDGKTFEQMKVYQKNKDRVSGIVRLRHDVTTLHGQDLSKLLHSSLTFNEADESNGFKTVERKRLVSIKEEIFSQLSKAIQ